MRVKPHKYTKEELQFFREYAVGHYRREIQEEFIKRFGWNITLIQIKNMLKKLNIKTGVKPGFPKGHVPANKGKKMPPDVYEKMMLGMAKRKTICPKQKSIGEESVTTNGYIKVKIAEPDVWEYKHRFMYEQYHNVKLKSDDLIIFVDNNKKNFDKDNLELINRSILSDINKHLNFNTDDIEIRKAVITLAKARYELKMKKQELRKE